MKTFFVLSTLNLGSQTKQKVIKSLTNKTKSNIFFNNKSKIITDGIYIGSIVGFKKRHRSKQDPA